MIPQSKGLNARHCVHCWTWCTVDELLSYQEGISETKWHVEQEAFLLMITILLLCGPALYFVLSQERAVMAERLLISVTLVGIAKRNVLCQHCSANTSVPEKLKMLKLVTSWLMSEVRLLTNSGLWEVMVSMLPFSQKGYAKLWDPISTYWKALKQ